MYRTVSEFLAEWRFESGATRRIMETLTDGSLPQRVCPDGRTLGYLAWHVVSSLGEIGRLAGLEVAAPAEDAPVPATAAALASAYGEASRSLTAAVKSQWDDAALAGEVEMFGERWTRARVLESMVRHQAHHRGQMTVLMRQAGLPVPGVYGPSKEEWACRGRDPLP